MNGYLLLIVLYFVVTTISGGTSAQENVKIMSYNLLNYPDVDSAIRNPNFRIVVRSAAPDILVVQEMTSQAGMDGFLSNVMNAYGNVYSAGTFIDGTDTDNGIFFKTAKFRFISNTRIRTALRDINMFKIVHVSYPADTLRIFSVHLKSSGGTANEQLRAAEVDSLRKFTSTLAPGQSYMVVGDFNIYGDYEQAYIKLKQVTNGNGHFVDPISGMTGSWNQFAYRQYHTQSPRVRGFGGGSTGGMDDRFDMMLFSPGIMNSGRIAYVAGSMTAFGNDGNHYNDSINRRPNTAVADSVADAIHYSSDHIPVYAVFTFGNSIGISTNGNEIPAEYSISQNYPNPFNPSTKIHFDIPASENSSGALTKMVVYDMLGRRVDLLVNQQLKPGSYSVDWDASDFPSGVYIYSISSGKYRESKKMILVK
ncbi:MAG: T9SS type A sorting domain-containing protein [Ignavibacteria bacterium]|nr:T9SS type A sorting domain-containing protein [Ignavibacteria bacterium]